MEQYIVTVNNSLEQFPSKLIAKIEQKLIIWDTNWKWCCMMLNFSLRESLKIFLSPDTGALKTQYIRTEKITQLGALWDEVNSLTRYFKINFANGFQQVMSNILCVSAVSSALSLSNYFECQNNK